ncbi:SH3 domain-containing C40 family peptidase [Desulfovibrio ferrophilus]|uniref:NLP/P60 protein n=1 Tax=Desulfovibrio ferrophilus TaxID=241368 RepID=A0A2Z6B0E8_9BACT|nr:SH3 domain-containing C40 family peptidase [Desulfovibrio ferrophilus]BBD08989.1 NLP/P60 protein [Desulfovibrio ferrophilus]
MSYPNTLPCWRRVTSAGMTVALLCLLLVGCATGPTPQGPIRDLIQLPQSPAAYLDPMTADVPMISPDEAQVLARQFVEDYFSPWHRSWPANDAEKVFKGLHNYDSARMFGENRQLRSPAWLEGLRRQSMEGDYPNARLRALTVVNTSMRVLPTMEPAFQDFNQAGEGYPFDYLQNTAVWAQTPLFVSHFSDDGAWALCESRFAYGWIPMRDIAMVDDEFAESFEQLDLMTFTSDRVPLYDDFGLFRFRGRVGMLLPFIAREDGVFQALIAVRDSLGRAVLASTSVPQCDGAEFPLEATAFNLALLGRDLMGQPYGWGGMYGHRDCSATLMDMFAALGIGLPRNSSQQARAGHFISLDGLDDQAKVKRILDMAQPWQTLLWKPGHIMLYIGQYEGRPVALHTTWGVKTKVGDREGRHFIGATVITTLAPGSELNELDRPDGILLHKIKGMTFLPGQTMED